MALFRICHFEPFQGLTLKLTGGVHCSMLYTLARFRGPSSNITCLLDPAKPHLRRLHLVFDPWGEVLPAFYPPVSRFRTPASFWPQMGIFQIWLKTVKTRGGYPRKCVFFPVFLFFRDGFVSLPYLSCLLVLRL